MLDYTPFGSLGARMTRKAYLYMRFSSAEQAQGDSLTRQRLLAEEYVARHPASGIELVSTPEFVDEGISSYAGQNLQPGRALRRFMECVADGTVEPNSILMVESLDRLSRQQVIQAQRLLLDLLLSGISVITTSPTETREYNGRSGLQDLIISLAGMERANQESAIKSDRVRRAWKRKKERAETEKLTKRAPSWLILSDDRTTFSILEEKAAVVRRVFELAETMGQTAIARMLNSEKVPPLVKGASGWHESSIAKLLTSSTVIGQYQPHKVVKEGGRTSRVPDGTAIEGYYPSIVSDDVYYRVQALRGVRKVTGAGRKGRAYANIFGGIAKCSCCGSSMTIVDKGSAPKGGRYFVCSAARRGAGCQYRAVKYRLCEQGFLLYCQRVDVSDILPGGGVKSEIAKLRKASSALRGEIAEKANLIERMVASIEANGGDMPKAVQNRIAEHEKRIEELQAEEARIASDIAVHDGEWHRVQGMQSSFTELMIRLRTAPQEEQYVLRSKLHEALKLAIAGIEVGPAHKSIEDVVIRLVEKERKCMLERHPEMFNKAEAYGIQLYHHVAGELTCFKVKYKNGNIYELFLDRNTAAAGRMTYTKKAEAELRAKGWTRPLGEIELVAGYPLPLEKKNLLRGKDGKFSSRPNASATRS